MRGINYNEEIIKTLISYVFTNIDELYGVAEEQKQCFVMEKSSCMKATQKAYSTKDGIHLLFPFIVEEKETYKTLRENLLTIDMEECKITQSRLMKNKFDKPIKKKILFGLIMYSYI